MPEQNTIAAALTYILTHVRSETSETFFPSMAMRLAEVLKADYTEIGELLDDHRTVRTLSLTVDGKIMENITYDLADTPCDNVVGKTICSYPSGAADRFPKDILLRQMGVEAYVGVPLFDAQQRPIGIMAAFYRSPLTDLSLVETILQLFALRVASEIERRRTEKILQESEEKYRTLIDKVQVAIIVHGADTRIVACNPMAEELLGLTEDQLLGKSAVDPDWHFFFEEGTAIPPEKYPVNQVFATRKALRGYVAGVHRPEREHDVWVLVNAEPIWDRDGGIAQVIVSFVDITERKRTESKLISIMKAVESTGDAIGISDAQGRHFFQNKALSDLFGYATAEELDAAGGGPAVVKDPAVAREMFEHIMSGRSWAGELEMVTKSGRVFPAYERADAIKDSEGNLVGLIGIIADITERKHAEEALHLFKDLVEHSSDAIGMSTPEGKHYFQNEAFGRMFGNIGEYPPETVFADKAIGKHVFDTIQGGGSWQGEVKMFKTDGAVLDIFLRAYAIKNREGRILGLVGLHTDITERKLAEDKTRISELRLKMAHRVAGMGNWEWNLVTNELFWAEENYRIFGLDPLTVEPSYEAFLQTVEPAEHALVNQSVADALAGRKSYDIDYTIIRPDSGARCVINAKAEVIFDSAGKAVKMVGTIQDITERKKIDDKLRESEARLREAQKIGKIGNWELDVASGSLWWSDEVYELFGLKAGGGLSFETFLKRIHPDDRQRVSEAIQDSISRALTSWQLEYRIVLDGGEVRFMHESATAELDASGRVIRRRGIVQDVTERKRTEVALHENAEQFRALVEQSLTGVTLIQDGKFVYVNPRLANMVGYTPEELLGRSPVDLVVTEDQEMVREKMRQRLSGEKDSANYTFRARHKNGTEVIMELYGRSTTYQEKRTLLSTMLDITERKKAEETVLKLSQAVEQSPISIVITDVKGNIEFVNPWFTKVTGYEAAEVLGKNPRILKSGETPPERYTELWETIAAGRVWEGEFHNKKKNGELFWEHAAISSIRDRDETITHYLGIKEDITERKKLEQQLSQAQKMEAIGQLAGGVAHDFNNILSTITGYASLLEMAIPADETLRDYVSEISLASERGANLTQSLLAFSRKQEPSLGAVDFNAQIRSSHKILSRLVGEDVDLVLDLDREDMVVEADAGQLQQVLMNLASNARDAMPSGGTLRIETRTDSIGSDRLERYALEQPGTYAILSVTDTGAGMEQSVRERIFEPFYTTKGVGKGTGLGLSIVYGIVKKHRGSITVDSEPGKGTSFRIYLPLGERSVHGSRASEALSLGAAGNRTVLIVEDEEPVRRVLRLTLEAYHYQVIEACDGEDAVRVFRENKDDVTLVLCDLVMPKKNGRQACEEMRKIRPDIKTIFMSGYTKDIFDQKGIMDSDITLLVKPINPKDLIQKISEVLEETQRPS